MVILKNGDIEKIKNIHYCKCDNCNCEFIYNNTDIITAIEVKKVNGIIKKKHVEEIRCPWCDILCKCK